MNSKTSPVSLLLSSLLTLTAFASEAQVQAEAAPAPQEVHIPVALSLLPGISTNGLTSSNVVNNFSFGLLATHAGRVEGVAISTGLNWTERESRALMVGAVGNISTGGFKGAQASGAFNLSGDKSLGLQAAGAVGIARADFIGIQTAGAVSYTGGAFIGLQASGAVSITRSDFTGLQTAGGLSLASRLRGAQISVVNIGGDVDGAQIGVVNIASRVRGLQLGVVNVASEMTGAPIGVVNAIGNGQLHVQGWASDTTATNVSLKYGSKHVYSLFTAGYQPGSEANRYFTLGLGIGGHIPMDRLFIDLDASSYNLRNSLATGGSDNLLAQLRVVAGYKVAPRFAVFAGVTGNVFIDFRETKDFEDLGGFSFLPSFEQENRSNSVRVWPGLAAGVQI